MFSLLNGLCFCCSFEVLEERESGGPGTSGIPGAPQHRQAHQPQLHSQPQTIKQSPLKPQSPPPQMPHKFSSPPSKKAKGHPKGGTSKSPPKHAPPAPPGELASKHRAEAMWRELDAVSIGSGSHRVPQIVRTR